MIAADDNFEIKYEHKMVHPLTPPGADVRPYAEVVFADNSGVHQVLRWTRPGELPSERVLERVRFRFDVPPPVMYGSIGVLGFDPPKVRVLVLSTATAYKIPMPIAQKAIVLLVILVTASVAGYVFRGPLTPLAWRLADWIAISVAFFGGRPRPRGAVEREALARVDLSDSVGQPSMAENRQIRGVGEGFSERLKEAEAQLRQELATDFANQPSDASKRIPGSGASVAAWSEFWTYLKERQVDRAHERYNEVRLRIEAQALQKVDNFLALSRKFADVERLAKEKEDKDLDLDISIEEKKQRLKSLRQKRKKPGQGSDRGTKFDAYYDILDRFRREAPTGTTRAEFAQAADDTLRARCFEEIKKYYGEQLRTDPDLKKKLEKDGFELD
ncbi:MAG: hypothetical protein HYR72_03715 [Deltaproteobacteria bacterium]|nr:hypothetical protein [Deltaproteobacteria bacterium]MBI3388704.1 hypothetical protein [Deltaproteobacteria bacterium]